MLLDKDSPHQPVFGSRTTALVGYLKSLVTTIASFAGLAYIFGLCIENCYLYFLVRGKAEISLASVRYVAVGVGFLCFLALVGVLTHLSILLSSLLLTRIHKNRLTELRRIRDQELAAASNLPSDVRERLQDRWQDLGYELWQDLEKRADPDDLREVASTVLRNRWKEYGLEAQIHTALPIIVVSAAGLLLYFMQSSPWLWTVCWAVTLLIVLHYVQALYLPGYELASLLPVSDDERAPYRRKLLATLAVAFCASFVTAAYYAWGLKTKPLEVYPYDVLIGFAPYDAEVVVDDDTSDALGGFHRLSCQVRYEGSSYYVIAPMPRSSLLGILDIKDPFGLIIRIKRAKNPNVAKGDPVAAHLRSRLSPKARRQVEAIELAKDGSATRISVETRRLLVRELNRILDGPCLYSQIDFPKGQIQDDARTLAEEVTRQEKTQAGTMNERLRLKRRRLNRLLIEDCFSEEIGKQTFILTKDKVLAVLRTRREE